MIKIENIVKRFGGQTVLTDVTFEVRDKEIFGLLGPSGAGKTTIINILTSQIKADSGSHSIGGTPMTLVMFIIFPVVAFIFTELVAKPDETIPNNMFITMMSAIFAGMALITSAAGAIAEDREHKSLRFLIMAGVKPHEYLIGMSGSLLLLGLVVSVVFTLMGDFDAGESVRFCIVLGLSVGASIILGATIGMFSKNQQSATALGMPVAMLLGFSPMIAAFNETAERIFSIFYTQQLNVVVNDVEAGIGEPLIVIAANIAVFTVLFIVAYRKRGLNEE